MARWVVGVVACGLAWSASARADDQEPTPAPPDVSWYATVVPAAAPIGIHDLRTRVSHSGVFALGGITYVDGAMNGRIDIGLPTPFGRLRHIRTIVITEFRYGSDPDGTETRNLAITPVLQYDVRLPIDWKVGDLVIVAASGLRYAKYWVKKPDEPYWPSTWESTTAYAFRVGAGIEYRGWSGLVVSLQPVSVGFPLNTPSPPDARFMESKPPIDYAVSIVTGYQFR
jgi:hypothetical protein